MIADSVRKLHEAVRSGEVSLKARVNEQSRLADRLDPTLGVFNARLPIEPRRLRESEDRIRDGEARPLEGVTVGVKDVISVEGLPTTGQSLAFQHGWGSGHDATAVARLRAAGAHIVGSTTTMELAYGLAERPRPFGYPVNPRDVNRFPGGSSSGSAVGLVAGMFDLALGTDTGGSIRIPSAMSGVVGLKPTFGAVPRDGVMPLGNTLDHVGPMALFAGLCRDAWRALSPSPVGGDGDAAIRADAPSPLQGLRIGVDRLDRHVDLVDPGQPARMDEALTVLEALGAEVIEMPLPYYPEQSAASLLALAAEASATWGSLARRAPSDLNRATRILLAAGQRISARDYLAAQAVRAQTLGALGETFGSVDVMVTPTSHLGAPFLSDVDPFAPTSFLPSVHTGYWSGTGMPSLSVPVGAASTGMPLAMLLNARHGADETVLGVAAAFQAATAHQRIEIFTAA